ncbi:MaoC family dehydratase [Caenispirillum salinarum]|uniref:MaoC family dehydratase n=1 Tax=Caenispirillum salinarum TaxID=859058 RepID=UPI00384BFEBB
MTAAPLLSFDDFQEGQVFDLGRRALSAEEIKAFARDWDPQPFHTDEAAAAESSFNGLCASGWHTGCVFMRMLVDGLLSRCKSMGSPGLDEVRWLAPVRPGQELAGRVTIGACKESRSKPDRGFISLTGELADAETGAVVYRMVAPVMVGR